MGEPSAPKVPLRAWAEEVGTSFHSGPDLAGLADQLAQIAEQLRVRSQSDAWLHNAHLDEPAPAASRHADNGHELALGHSVERSHLLQLARQIYALRREREAIFGKAELFGEPAWDILLDLYVAHVERKSVSVSSACIGSASPPTTGLRWLGILAEEGFVIREADPQDQRRVLVRLSDKGLAAMDRYLNLTARRI